MTPEHKDLSPKNRFGIRSSKKRRSRRIQRTFYQSDHDERVFSRKPGKLKIRWKWRMWIQGMGLVATYYGWSEIKGSYFGTPHQHFIERLGSTGELLDEKS